MSRDSVWPVLWCSAVALLAMACEHEPSAPAVPDETPAVEQVHAHTHAESVNENAPLHQKMPAPGPSTMAPEVSPETAEPLLFILITFDVTPHCDYLLPTDEDDPFYTGSPRCVSRSRVKKAYANEKPWPEPVSRLDEALAGYRFHRFQEHLTHPRRLYRDAPGVVAEKATYRPAYTVFINTMPLMLSPRFDPVERPQRYYRMSEREKTLYAGWAAKPESWKHLLFNMSARKAGSNIHFAGTPLEIEMRLALIRRLANGFGVEIAGHAVRHHRGRGRDADWWRQELYHHQRILELHGLERPEGFRAPYLQTALEFPLRGESAKDPVYRLLDELGYRYDSSSVHAIEHEQPYRAKGTQVHLFPVASISRAVEPLCEGKDDCKEPRVLFFGDVGKVSVETYRAYFLREFMWRYAYLDEDAWPPPLLVSGHGERLRSTLRILQDLCHRPRVRCSSVKDYLDYRGW